MSKIMKKILPLILIAAHLFCGFNTAFAVERVSVRPITTNQKTPSNYVFQLKGSSNKYILLDDTDEGYFVMTLKFCAKKTYAVDGKPVPFDPENQNSIAYWLNHDFLESGYLPDVIIENLIERDYITEGGGSKVSFSNDYKSRCKVVMLSQTEWSKYNSKFGYGDDTSNGYWGLRSVRGLTGANLVAPTTGSSAGLTADGKWGSNLGIRPAFYLPKDFFEKASVDVANTGDTVIATIRNNSDAATLSQMYNSVELYTVAEESIAPVADGVAVIGRGIVGETIDGKYFFDSLDGSFEDGTQIQWERSRTKFWWSTIVGAESLTYAPTESDIGYYIRMKVSPMTDSRAGKTYTSSPLGVTIRAISTPVASNVRIVANEDAKPGTILDVKYSYSDENRDLCSETEYIWESSTDKVATQTIGNSRYYKLTNNEAGKFVRVGVIPKKQTNSASGRQTVAGALVYTDWMAVENLPMASDVTVSKTVVADMSVSVSKTDQAVTIKNILVPSENEDGGKFMAEYNIPNGEYTVVFEWQGSGAENGKYAFIGANPNVLDYDPSNMMWVRAKVYTVLAGKRGEAVYSGPVLIGTDKVITAKGEYTATMNLYSGKTYEIWISNEVADNSYAYSFKLDGDWASTITSNIYSIKNLELSDGSYIIGTIAGDMYGDGATFKAGEITADKDGTLTISDVQTSAADSKSLSKARVYIVEK